MDETISIPEVQSSTSLHALRRRFLSVWLFVLMVVAGILCRSAYIQVVRDPRIESLAKRQFRSNVLLKPKRGAILDRNGEVLAVSVESSSLAANPGKILNKVQTGKALARVLGIPQGKLRQKLQENRDFVWIKRHLTEDEMARLKKVRVMDAEGDLISGLWLVKEGKRIYPHGDLAAHTLGDVNIDSDGIEGLELKFNSKLAGVVSSVSAIRDALGRPAFIDVPTIDRVVNGEVLKTTLDAPLQYEVEQSLASSVRSTGSKAGIIIVLNADNGEILALANEPAFRRGSRSYMPELRRNRALTDGFEPGSILKPILLASALGHGFTLKDKIWGENGSFVLQGVTISEAEAKEKFEWLSLQEMIQVSSNVVAAKLALKLGREKYHRTLRAFGFGQRTGIEFPGEISGKIPELKGLGSVELANQGFGQGILVTALQMARAYAVLANGGFLVKPKLFQSGSVPPASRVISSGVSRQVTEALLRVTQPGGTGLKAALEGIQVAGKTGTAQLVEESTGTYSKSKYIASFVGYPVGISPRVVILAELVEPKGVYYAAETAAPLFKDVLAAVVNRMGVPGHIVRPEGGKELGKIKDTLPMVQSFSTRVDSDGFLMPPLVGQSTRDILHLLKGVELKVLVHGTGKVVSQKPEPGSKLKPGDRVEFFLEQREAEN